MGSKTSGLEAQASSAFLRAWLVAPCGPGQDEPGLCWAGLSSWSQESLEGSEQGMGAPSKLQATCSCSWKLVTSQAKKRRSWSC